MFSFRGVNKSVNRTTLPWVLFNWPWDLIFPFTLIHVKCQPGPQVGYTVYHRNFEAFFGQNPSPPVGIPFQQNRVNFVSWCLSLFTFFCCWMCVCDSGFLTPQKKTHVFGKRRPPSGIFGIFLLLGKDPVPKETVTMIDLRAQKQYQVLKICCRMSWLVNQPTTPTITYHI